MEKENLLEKDSVKKQRELKYDFLTLRTFTGPNENLKWTFPIGFKDVWSQMSRNEKHELKSYILDDILTIFMGTCSEESDILIEIFGDFLDLKDFYVDRINDS